MHAAAGPAMYGNTVSLIVRGWNARTMLFMPPEHPWQYDMIVPRLAFVQSCGEDPHPSTGGVMPCVCGALKLCPTSWATTIKSQFCPLLFTNGYGKCPPR
jgi:hypothetical protein